MLLGRVRPAALAHSTYEFAVGVIQDNWLSLLSDTTFICCPGMSWVLNCGSYGCYNNFSESVCMVLKPILNAVLKGSEAVTLTSISHRSLDTPYSHRSSITTKPSLLLLQYHDTTTPTSPSPRHHRLCSLVCNFSTSRMLLVS